MKRWILAALPLLALVLACQSTTRGVDYPRPYVANGVEVEVKGVLKLSTKFHGVYGSATNVSAGELDSVTVTFDVLDAQGARVGTAKATTEDLGPGQTWKFQAKFARQVDDVVTVLKGNVWVDTGGALPR